MPATNFIHINIGFWYNPNMYSVLCAPRRICSDCVVEWWRCEPNQIRWKRYSYYQERVVLKGIGYLTIAFLGVLSNSLQLIIIVDEGFFCFVDFLFQTHFAGCFSSQSDMLKIRPNSIQLMARQAHLLANNIEMSLFAFVPAKWMIRCSNHSFFHGMRAI